MNTISTEPKTIKRDGEVGFRGQHVEFVKDHQTVIVSDRSGSVEFSITDFLNLVEQASWYFDEFASKEER